MDERRIASNANLRYIYKEDNVGKTSLPQSIVNIIEKAKAKRTRLRGKGKNDIETLLANATTTV